MVESCIFCRIAQDNLPSHKVYEDDKILAFLDKYPLARGHVLIIPKAHVSNIDELSGEDAQALFHTLFKLTKAVQRGLKTGSTTIGINNGPDSGQEVPHLHLHIIPRFPGDGGGPVHAVMRQRPSVSDEEMLQITKAVKENISA